MNRPKMAENDAQMFGSSDLSFLQMLVIRMFFFISDDRSEQNLSFFFFEYFPHIVDSVHLPPHFLSLFIFSRARHYLFIFQVSNRLLPKQQMKLKQKIIFICLVKIST